MDDRMGRLTKGGEGYPQALLELPQPPETLYFLGDPALLLRPAAAIVGSRKCSEYGRRTAMALGLALARSGIVTVSGMAKGIDSFGHIGALKGGGPTIAILGCGVDVCYPRENANLYAKILAQGLLLSEYPPGTEPRPYHFPQRNRLIAALCAAVAVVEADFQSGSLITAELAAELGRQVFSVPGNITSQWSMGTNKLIADGATPLIVVEDLVRAVGGPAAPKPERLTDETLSAEERRVLSILWEKGEVELETLCHEMGRDPVNMRGLVTVLEMKGLVFTNFGKIFIASL